MYVWMTVHYDDIMTDKCTNDWIIPTEGYKNWCSAFLSIIKSDVFWDSGVDELAYPWEQDVTTDKITSEIKLILVKPLMQSNVKKCHFNEIGKYVDRLANWIKNWKVRQMQLLCELFR
jgi:hypothetical protein